MRKQWIGYLLALFALLWAKLPGPSVLGKPKPYFQVKPSDKAGESETVEVSTRTPNLQWLPAQSERITIQKAKRRPGGWRPAEGVPLRSPVKVTFPSPGSAKLHDITPEVKERLLSGTGHYAIVLGKEEKVGEETRFHKLEDMIVEGKGQGIWKILERQQK